jgi:hypothetical protein
MGLLHNRHLHRAIHGLLACLRRFNYALGARDLLLVLILLLPIAMLGLAFAIGLFTLAAWLKALVYACETKFMAAGARPCNTLRCGYSLLGTFFFKP